jgi:Flp pilus assembly protein CpaB
VKRSNRLLVLMGLLLAIVGGGVAYAVTASGTGGGSANASPTATPEPTTTVVIATQDINLGDRITKDMVTTKSMTVSERARLGIGTFTTVDEVVGKVAGGKITANQPLIAGSDFLNNGSITDGKDIAGAIASGYQAISIELDQVNGVGTLIVPGDRVNIILAVYVPGLDLQANRPGFDKEMIKGVSDVTAKTVIQNRKVLLTLLPAPVAEPTGAAAAGSAPPVQAAPTVPVVHNDGRHMIAVIEVKPDEAEIIRWAQREEKLDPQNYITLGVTLRSDKDNSLPDAVTPGITFKMLVDKYGVLPPDPRAIIPADIARNLQW